MLSLINAGLVGTRGSPAVVCCRWSPRLALAYGGVAQFTAGIWEFRTGNTFGAVAFCSYGAFWISFYFIVQSVGQNAPTVVFSGLGLYLWMWGIFTAYMFIASLRTTGAVALVFLLLAITFIILGIGNSSLAGTASATNGTIKLGGYLGIATAICRLVRVVRRGHQLDLRPSGGAGRSAPSIAEKPHVPRLVVQLSEESMTTWSAGGDAGALGCPASRITARPNRGGKREKES